MSVSSTARFKMPLLFPTDRSSVAILKQHIIFRQRPRCLRHFEDAILCGSSQKLFRLISLSRDAQASLGGVFRQTPLLQLSVAHELLRRTALTSVKMGN